MLGKTHKIGGYGTGAIASTALYLNSPYFQENMYLAVPLIAGSWVGSLMPDVDHPKSYMGRRLWFLSKPINKLFGHRGFTHTLLALVLTTLPLFLLSAAIPTEYQKVGEAILMLAVGYGLGYGNHLFLDCLNPTGAPLLYPFFPKSFRIAKIPTGKHEDMVSVLIIVITFLIVGGLVFIHDPAPILALF